MKTFVLALTLFAADGTTTQVPLEMWHFASMAECAKSSAFMGKGTVASAPNYSCIEYDPSLNVARTRPQDAPPKRNS